MPCKIAHISSKYDMQTEITQYYQKQL